VDPGQNISIFLGKFKKFLFSGNFTQKSMLPNKIFQNFRKFSIFSGNFTKEFNFLGKNWPFTTTPGQIILFLFKSHHFQT